MKKSVGIIEAGHVGATIAEIERRGGRRVVLSNSRGPETLTSTSVGCATAARCSGSADLLPATT
jgi:predicted dinucleotide-binding enzyme